MRSRCACRESRRQAAEGLAAAEWSALGRPGSQGEGQLPGAASKSQSRPIAVIAGIPQNGPKADLAGRCLQGPELSVARMVLDGRGAETYLTFRLVEFNWIGVLVMTVAAWWRRSCGGRTGSGANSSAGTDHVIQVCVRQATLRSSVGRWRNPRSGASPETIARKPSGFTIRTCF